MRCQHHAYVIQVYQVLIHLKIHQDFYKAARSLTEYQETIKLTKIVFQILGRCLKFLHEMSTSCICYPGVSSFDSFGVQKNVCRKQTFFVLFYKNEASMLWDSCGGEITKEG